ncbi:MAG: hypothetical protein ABIH18_09605 [Candidatus Omnitrophota bacterium]
MKKPLQRSYLKQEQGLLWVYYISGIVLWFLVCKFLFGSVNLTKFPFLGAHLFCIIFLAINLLLQVIEKKYIPNKYNLEEKIYEYVERNTYYLVMAITIFLLISTGGKTGLFAETDINFKLIVYSQASAMVFCIFIIALYWMPTKEGKEHCLVHLRHIKTVIFTYALSLFFLSPVEVFIKLRATF